MSTIFSLSSLTVMPFWILMIFLPDWGWTKRILSSPWVAAGAAIIYVALVLPQVSSILPAVINPDLNSISVLLGTPSGAAIAWVHFLAFDLFVGRWIYLDSRAQCINPIAIAAILFFTLMLGPLGFFAYLITRLFVKQNKLNTVNQASAA